MVVYGLSTYLLWFSEKVKKNQRRWVEYFVIFILCLLAGLRSEDVGTDMENYFVPLIEAAQKSNSYTDYLSSTWSYGWALRNTREFEVGFRLFVYMISKLFRSTVVVQFAVQLLIIGPVYVALKRRKDIPLWFGMLVYLLIFNNLSFNAIRQAIAQSLTLLSFQLWTEGNKKKALLVMASGCLFHLSALIGFGILLIYEMVQRDQGRALKVCGIRIDARYANMVLVIVGVLLFVLGANFVASFLNTFFRGKFSSYISGNLVFMPNQLIKLLLPLAMMILNFRDMEHHSDMARFNLCAVIISILLLQFTSVYAFSTRIADYFMYFGIFSYPQVCKRGKLTGLLALIMVGYLVFYWVFYFGIGNSGETIPYTTIFG